jgi:class 3 adenylate cyclase/WD40 repeat protein/RecA/RadA recombinase
MDAGDRDTKPKADPVTTSQTATFLFCDTVGSTELLTTLGLHTAEIARRRLFAALREAIRATGGEEVKSLGDGLMVVFRASAADAVACAIAMQRAVDQLNSEHPLVPLAMRVGLSCGEATLATDEQDWYGAAVNTAARLCAAAAPRQIVATTTVAEVVGDITGMFKPIGELALKGIPYPVAATDVQWSAQLSGGAVPLPTAFDVDDAIRLVGRDADLATLRQWWAEATTGRSMSVLVAGEPGVGKTRLARELAVACHRAGAIVLYGRATVGHDSPLEPLAEAVRWYAAAVTTDELTDVLGDLASDLVEVLPALRFRLGTIPARLVRHEEGAVAALDRLLVAASERAPVLLVVDDVHLASTRLLGALAELNDRPGLRLMTVALTREDGPLPRLARDRLGGRTIRLEPLDAGAVGDIVNQLRPEIGPALATAIAEATGGNPRDIIEAVRNLAAADLGPTTDGDDGARAVIEHTCPYRGLAAYGPRDHALFHGRDTLVATTLARLARSRLVGVIGASGSGKTSVLQAGLVPALARGALAGSDAWPVVFVRPGSQPTRNLAAALAALARSSEDLATLEHALLEPGGLDRVSRQLVRDPATRVVLVIDQFEELFTLSAPDERDLFLDGVLTAAAVPGGVVSVVLAVRADFYGELAARTVLATAVDANHVLVGPMTTAELAQAVTQPAFVAGLRLDEGLVETVVHDTAGQPGALPLLSHALLETWRRREVRTLTLAGYHAAGGVHGAIARTAEHVYAGLPTADQEHGRGLFLRLVNPGQGSEDTRRRVDITELPAAEIALVPQLVAARLLTADEHTVEVAHEALIREWPRLRAWLDEDRDGLRLHHQLTTDAVQWDLTDRDQTYLYSGTRLDIVRAWARASQPDLNTVERAFLDNGHRRQRSRARRRRAAIVSLAVVTIAALVAAAVAFRAQARATNLRDEADLRRLVTDAHAVETDDLARAALLAREANLREDSPRTRGALEAALVSNPSVLGYLVGGATQTGRLALTGDGRTLVVGRNDGKFEIWDTATRRQTSPPLDIGQLQNAPGMTIDETGNTIAVARPDHTFALWNLVTRQPIVDPLPIPVESGAVANLFTPSPSYLPGAGFLLVSNDQIYVQPVDGSDARVVYRARSMLAAAVSPDATVVVVLSADEGGTGVTLVDPTSWQPRLHFATTLQGFVVSSISINADTTRLAISLASQSGASAVFDLTTGQLVRTVDGTIPVAAYASDAPVLVSGTSAAVLQRRDPLTAEPQGAPVHLAVQSTALGDVVVDASGDRAYLAIGNGVVIVDLSGNDKLSRLVAPLTGFAVPSLDGNRFAVTNRADGRVTIVDGATHASVTAAGLDTAGTTLATTVGFMSIFSPDGSAIAVGGTHDRVLLVDSATGAVTATISIPRPREPHSSFLVPQQGAEGLERPMSWSPDGRTLYVNGWDSVSAIDVGARRVRYQVTAWNDLVESVVVAPAGDLVAGTDFNGNAIVFDANGGTVISHLAGHWAAFLPDGSLALNHWSVGQSTTTGGVLEIHDPRTGRSLEPPIRMVQDPALITGASVDSRTLYVATIDLTFRLYDRGTGQPIGVPFPDFAPMRTAPGEVVASGARVAIWDVDPTSWRAKACEVAGRNLTRDEWTRYLPTGAPYRATCPQFPSAA